MDLKGPAGPADIKVFKPSFQVKSADVETYDEIYNESERE